MENINIEVTDSYSMLSLADGIIKHIDDITPTVFGSSINVANERVRELGIALINHSYFIDQVSRENESED